VLTIGLTGSIGMGKSTTAAMFRELGVPVHDSDAAVHELYASSAVFEVSAAFPGVVRDGAIDRNLLAAKVLGDRLAIRRLQEIVHPKVLAHRQEFLQRIRAGGYPFCVVDVPLLFETGAEQSVNVILVVTSTPDVQKQRVMSRPGMTTDKFEAIISNQMPDREKRRRAHWIIETTNGIACARRQVSGILRALGR
jgi:dephospho-CoA kinase